MPKYKVSVVAEWVIEVEADGPVKAEGKAMDLVENMNRWSPRPNYFTGKPSLIEGGRA